MQESVRQCPKCGQVLQPPLPASARCPACGLYFFKWSRAVTRPPVPEAAEAREASEIHQTLVERLLAPRAELDTPAFYGRCLVLALLAVWSWFLVRADFRDGEIFDSFMHNILLPIHEAGHVFLMPFGEFLTILGGSLLQLALPLGIGIAFVVRNRDNYAAAVCLWWASVSLLDLSPYIYDALYPQLTLLGGHTGEDGPHDWIYLLDVFGQLGRAQHWGSAAHTLGTLLALAALGWAALILKRQRRNVDA